MLHDLEHLNEEFTINLKETSQINYRARYWNQIFSTGVTLYMLFTGILLLDTKSQNVGFSCPQVFLPES